MKLRETPCERCGWKYPGDHCCIDLSTPEARIAANRIGPLRRKAPMPQSQRDNISESKQEYWAAYRESNKKRDAEIVARYNLGDIGQPQLAQEFGISKTTVQKILKQAAIDGLTRIRRHGVTVDYDRDNRVEA